MDNLDLVPYTATMLQAFLDKHSRKARVRVTEYDYRWSIGKEIPIGITERHGFRKVTKPMPVFKKVYVSSRRIHTIANLIIPVGAMFYVDSGATSEWANATYRKMRASEAQVVSLFRAKSQLPEPMAYSGHNGDFIYKPGEIVKPVGKFSREEDQCQSGIHFFINLGDAINWW